jgi:hypothetical protein
VIYTFEERTHTHLSFKPFLVALLARAFRADSHKAV